MWSYSACMQFKKYVIPVKFRRLILIKMKRSINYLKQIEDIFQKVTNMEKNIIVIYNRVLKLLIEIPNDLTNKIFQRIWQDSLGSAFSFLIV